MALKPSFVSSNIEKIAPKIEEWIRKELGVSSSLRYQIEKADARSTTFTDLLRAGLGGSMDEIHRLVFDLPHDKPVSLRVSLWKFSYGSVIGTLLYSGELSKPISGEVRIEKPDSIMHDKFVGDSTVADKLNGDRELVKRANQFISQRLSLGGGTSLKAEGYFGIRPYESKSLLIARTMLKQNFLGGVFGLGGLSFGVNEFFDIASTIDAAL